MFLLNFILRNKQFLLLGLCNIEMNWKRHQEWKAGQ